MSVQGPAFPSAQDEHVSLGKRLLHARQYLQLAAGFTLLGVGCLIWSALAIPALVLIPRRLRHRIGQVSACWGFWLYLKCLVAIGVVRLDIRALDALRDQPPMLLTPNHPGMLDALMVISRLSNVVTVLKASIIQSPFFGAGARLAGYVRNDLFVGTIGMAVDALRAGSHVLLFPEGTRTAQRPISPLNGSVSVIAARANVPVQIIVIDTDSNFLGKTWHFWQEPQLPVHFSVRLGARIDPPHSRALMDEMDRAFREALTPH